jgi:DNA-binding NtrC family response regulator
VQCIYNSRILIVDDDANAILAHSLFLKSNGFSNIVTETDSRCVLDKMSLDPFDAVILDLFMPHLNGIDLLPQLRERYPHVPVIMATSSYDVKLAVECMKRGAVDYLTKPVESELLVASLCKAVERNYLAGQISSLRDRLINDRLDHPEAFTGIVTRNRKMRSIFEYMEVISATTQVVLITGESGTGKELAARAVHRLSGCEGEFVAVNLAGVDDTMLSDTLFGHKKGAFTGADQEREGLIVKAAGGTIFLDEIGDLSEHSQVKILRLIQEREFYPGGADTPRKCMARFICASNRDLKALVAAGKFRKDLYYRLNVHHVALPPLRERKEDIPLLLDHFIDLAAHEVGIKAPSFPVELMELLDVYHFPGNVRELQVMVFDAVTQSRGGVLSLEPFRRFINLHQTQKQPNPPLPEIHEIDHRTTQSKLESIWGHFPTLREADELLIDTALNMANGNQGIAATMLGLKRPAFNMRLRARKKRSL